MPSRDLPLPRHVSLVSVVARVVALVAALAVAPRGAAAQDTTRAVAPPLSSVIPADTAVTVGTLPNGLRYYIRVNHKPEKRAELRLVVNAGSVLEDSSQRGLAHFVEHMAFSGTKHFARQQLVNYLESTGVRFGADLNASTGFDETVYELTVPTDSAKLLDTGVEILEDWAHAVTFDSAQVDRERGVVIEEWRLGQGAEQRIRDKQFPVLFAHSRYAERIPIGDKHTIETAKRGALMRFYNEWYRPDLMAVVAVGDFDKARMERLIRAHFTSIPAPPHAEPRPVYPVPDHDSTLVTIATDPEETTSSVALYYLQPVREERTVGEYREQLVESLYDGMLNERLSEIAQRPGAPFLGAGSGQGRFIRSKEVYVLSAVVTDGGIARGLGALLTEAERVAQHGFTQTELDRQKRELLRDMERAYAERDKTSSSELVGDYIGNYLDDDPIPSVAEEWQLTRALVPGITVGEVNHLASAWLAGKSRVITAAAPAKDSASMPTEHALLVLADSVERAPVVAYVDSSAGSALVPHAPAAGRVVAEQRIPALGIIDWTLSNGVHVVVKPTTFKDDEILVRAFGPGGTSLAPDSLYIPARTATTAVEVGGVGGFSAIALGKALAGKSVSVSPWIGSYEEGIAGSGSPKDVESLFQLIYLYFTAPRADSSAFSAYQARARAILANRSASPEAAFGDTLTAVLWQHAPRMAPFTSASVDRMDLDRSLQFYRDRFADASAFTFIFVGNIDTLRLKPLVETYLASLPATHRGERWRDVGLDYARGVVRREVRQGDEPKSETSVVFTGAFDYTRAHLFQLSSLAEVLRIELRQRLREQLGGTYDVDVSASGEHYPRERYALSIDFGSAPGRAATLTRALFAAVDTLKVRGPSAADIQKVREISLREWQTNRQQNGYWSSVLQSYLSNGWDPREILEMPDLIGHIDAASIRDAARRYLDEKNYVQVALFPSATTGHAPAAKTSP